MKARQIVKNDNKKPIVVNEKKLKSPSVRTILYVEVGNSTTQQIQKLLAELQANAAASINSHPHYFVPVRNGKITSDVVIEAEWEKVVRETCEIKDGQICLKDGAKNVQIIRESV